MSLTRKVAHQTIIQIGARFLSVVLGVLIIAWVMRYLGPQEYGYYSIALAFLQIFGIIASFGLYLITLRYLGEIEGDTNLSEEAKKEKTDFVMENIFTFRFFSALLIYGLAFVLSLFFPYPSMVKIGILILSLSLFLNNLIQILSAFCQKTFKARVIALGEILGKIVLLLFIIFIIHFNLGFFAVLLAFGLGALADFLLLFFITRNFVKLKFRYDFSFWREIFFFTWLIGLGLVFNTIYFKADTLILSFYHSAVDVGIYGACYRVLEILVTFPPLFLGLILPKISALWLERNYERLKIILQKSFDFLVMVAMPLIFGTLVLARKVMVLIGGPEFIRSGDVLKIIILATGILFVAELFKQAIISLNEQSRAVWLYLLTTAFALIGYFLFIPNYSYIGAAWMTVAAETLMFILALWLVWRKTKFLPNLNFFWKSLLSSLMMFVILLIFQSWNLFILILLASTIYFLCLYLLKGISKEMIKEIIKI